MKSLLPYLLGRLVPDENDDGIDLNLVESLNACRLDAQHAVTILGEKQTHVALLGASILANSLKLSEGWAISEVLQSSWNVEVFPSVLPFMKRFPSNNHNSGRIIHLTLSMISLTTATVMHSK